jgi:hypothetical protein
MALVYWQRSPPMIQTGATVDTSCSAGMQLAYVRVRALPDIRAGEAAFVKRHVRDGDVGFVPLRELAGERFGD